MKLRIIVLALGLMAAWVLPANAATLRFAVQVELKSLAPYSRNEGVTLVEDLAGKVLVESDKGTRDLLIKEAYTIAQEQDWGYISLHQQALAWMFEEGQADAARRQPDTAVLVPQGLSRNGV